MSDAANNVDRVLDLAEAICDENATENVFAELDSMVLSDQASCRHYLGYCQMHVALRLELRAGRAAQKVHHQIDSESLLAVPVGSHTETVVTAPAMPPTFFSATIQGAVGFFSSGWPVAYLMATLIFGIGLLIGSLVHVSQPVQIVRHSLPPGRMDARPNIEPVGRITGMVDCKWAGVVFDSPGVPLGRRYELASGLMEITYDTGAKVVLQGPVTYEVESKNGGFLSLGRLTGKVTTEVARGFIIRTPTAIVTDLGTEFGVEVTEASTSVVHVFRGAIELQPRGQSGVEKSVRLVENESASVERDAAGRLGVATPSRVFPASFVRSEQLQQLASQQQSKGFRHWQAYSDRICRDPALVAYYDFQRRDDSPDVLHAVGNGPAGALDGAIEGATWTTGRMTGKQALRFDGDQARVKVSLPQRMTQMTLAAWVAIEFITDREESGSGAGGLLMSDDWGYRPDKNAAEKCHWQIVRTGEICLGSVGSGRWMTPPVLPWQEWRKQRWRHLAVAADPSNRRVTSYLDGVAVFTGVLPQNFRVTFGSAQIGNWQPMAGQKERPFCGWMDELVILGRAMTGEEIMKMCEAGRR